MLKNRMIKEIIRRLRSINDEENFESFLISLDDLRGKKLLFEFYLTSNDYENASEVFSILEEEEDIEQAYLDYFGQISTMNDLTENQSSIAEKAKALMSLQGLPAPTETLKHRSSKYQIHHLTNPANENHPQHKPRPP